MIEAVLVFATLSAIFEGILLWRFVPQWVRRYPRLIHAFVFGVNLWIHFGTMTGSMTAITAGLASFFVEPLIPMKEEVKPKPKPRKWWQFWKQRIVHE